VIILRLSALLIATWLCLPSPASAVPAAGIEEIVTGADGSQLVAVTRGDEWTNWMETATGFAVAPGLDGNWYYVRAFAGGVPVLDATPAVAPPPPDLPKGVQPQRESGPLAAPGESLEGPPSLAPVGPFSGPVLFILASFSDRAGSTTEASWATFIDQSIADYFDEVSYGAVDLTPATESFGTANNGVVGWLNLGYPHPNTGSNTDDDNQLLTRNAILAANPYVNFAAYDGDLNGYVDADELAVVVIVAGYERSYSSNLAPNVWGHKWSIQCCGGAPVVDGVIVGSYNGGNGGYAQFGELHASNGSDGHQATMGIMVHELGHLIFGLPDLYDTDGSSQGVGAFSVMGGGSWGKRASDTWQGMTPVAPCAWTKYDRGWVDGAEGGGVEAIVAGGAPSATAANTVFRASSGVGSQYFLVENRQNIGYDAGLQFQLGQAFSGGVAIWHIDETRSTNADDAHRKVDLEQADDTESAGSLTDLWYVGNATAFTDQSLPSSRLYDGSPTGWAISTQSGPGVSMNVAFAHPVCGNGIVEPSEACDGAADDACPGDCTASCQCALPDACAAPQIIADLPFTGGLDTTTATTEPTDPFLTCGAGGQQFHSVWFSFEAPVDGTVTADTVGSNYDTVLAALTGTCGSLTQRACNDDTVGLQSRITFPVTAGTTYLLEITAYGSGNGGQLVLNVQLEGCGDGALAPGEACDDDNVAPGDGCSATCSIEPCWACGGAPSVCTPDDGAGCGDGSVCNGIETCQDGTCVGGSSLPQSGCRQTLDPTRSSLELKNRIPDLADAITWKWDKGEATLASAFGAPENGDDYSLCVYDESAGSGVLLFEAAAPAGGLCGTKPCWKALGTPAGAQGHKYTDKAGTPHGVSSLLLKPGTAGKAKVQLKAKGENTPVPVLPLPTPVDLRVQLRAGNGECWEGWFGEAGTLKNDASQYKAKGSAAPLP